MGGCRILCHLMRPGNIRASSHRACLAAEPSRLPLPRLDPRARRADPGAGRRLRDKPPTVTLVRQARVTSRGDRIRRLPGRRPLLPARPASAPAPNPARQQNRETSSPPTKTGPAASSGPLPEERVSSCGKAAPTICPSGQLGQRYCVRNKPLNRSPLTESNRRPSPYHETPSV